MTEYLKQKWLRLRMYRTRNTFPVDYRIIKNTDKIMGLSMPVAALSPVNKTAALVVSKGVHYEMNCKIQTPEFIGPPKMIPRHLLPKAPSFIDLTGRQKGRLKVVGLMAEEKGKWVVRCACGTYTVRNTKVIKSIETNPNAMFDACRECMHFAQMKRRVVYRRTGKDLDISGVW